MVVFSVVAGVLLLISMALVLWPLWWGKQADSSRQDANVVVYEQHTAEIQRELAAGQITSAAATARRNDLDAQLLSDVDETALASDYTTRRPWLASAAVVTGFAVLAIGLYGLLGDTRGLAPQQTPDISGLVAKMKSRLAAVPGDRQTRALLGQVQMAQDKYAAAAQTFAQINQRAQQPNVTYLLAEARARVLNNNGRVDERAQALYEQALTLSSDSIEALWFAGLAALADGQNTIAAQHWRHLLAQDIPKEFRARVKRRLAEATGKTPELNFGN